MAEKKDGGNKGGQFHIIPTKGFPLNVQVDKEIQALLQRREEYELKLRTLAQQANEAKVILHQIHGALQAYNAVKDCLTIPQAVDGTKPTVPEAENSTPTTQPPSE